MKRNKLAAAISIALGVSPLSLLAQDIQVPQIAEPEIEEVIVFGEFVPDEKRDTSEISNLLNLNILR